MESSHLKNLIWSLQKRYNEIFKPTAGEESTNPHRRNGFIRSVITDKYFCELNENSSCACNKEAINFLKEKSG